MPAVDSAHEKTVEAVKPGIFSDFLESVSAPLDSGAIPWALPAEKSRSVSATQILESAACPDTKQSDAANTRNARRIRFSFRLLFEPGNDVEREPNRARHRNRLLDA